MVTGGSAAVGRAVEVAAGAVPADGTVGGVVTGSATSGPILFVVATAVALLIWPGRPRLAGFAPGPTRVGPRPARRRAWRTTFARGRAVRLPAGVLAAAGAVTALRGAPWQGVIAGLLVGFTVVRTVRRGRAAARSRRACAALTAALRGVVRELRAGVPPRDALGYAAADAAPEIRLVLEHIARREDDGPEVAWRLPPVPAEVVDGLRHAWLVALSRGVPLAAVLTACLTGLDDRAAATGLRAQHVAGPAVSGYLLAALPVAGIAMGAGMGARPVDILLGGPVGGALLVIGVGLCCAGVLWTGRIVRGDG